MSRKISIALLMMTTLLSSCTRHGGWDVPYDYWTSYIQLYFDCSEISVTEHVDFYVDETSNTIFAERLDVTVDRICKINEGIALHVELFGDRFTAESDPCRFNEISQRIGDISFNKYIYRGSAYTAAITENLKLCRVFVNEDYNETYKAGDNVSELFTIYYDYPKALIDNGYIAPAGTYRFYYMSDELPQAVFKEKLSTAHIEDKTALGSEIWLVLNQAPSVTGNYTFRIEIMKEDNQTLITTTSNIKIKGE